MEDKTQEEKQGEQQKEKPAETEGKKCCSCSKNPITLIVAIIVIIIIGLLIFGGDREVGDVDTETETEAELEAELSAIGESEPLDMQGFYLYPPPGYHCEGGFTDGYRYLDAECYHEDRDDYEIEVQHGFTATTVDPDGGLVAHQVSIRSHDLTGERDSLVCRECRSELVKRMGGEHYICFYQRDGKDVIIIGFGKTFPYNGSAYARWSEAELTVKDEDAGYTQEEYNDILAKFLGSSIKVDWSEYAPE